MIADMSISPLKLALPERAYFIGRRQPKVTEDLEIGALKAQSPKLESDDETERPWWRTYKLFVCLGCVLVAIALLVWFYLMLHGILPDIPNAATRNYLADAAARESFESIKDIS
jgi:hypothetical protein